MESSEQISARNGKTEDHAKEELYSFDDILEKLGGFGPLQRRIFILISLADIHGAFAMLLPIFVGATPRWHCVRYHGINVSNDINSSWTNYSASDQQCWYGSHQCKEMHFQDDFTTVVSEWQLVCGLQHVSSVVTSLQLAGVLLGVTIYSQVSDTVGRRISYYSVVCILLVAGFISALSVCWEMYAACRFVVGFGYGGMHTVNSIFTVELVSRKWRSLCGTVGFWAVGTMLLALLGYLIRDWRHLAMAVSLSGLPYLITWWWVPESPRWLLQQGRDSEAHETMSKIALSNGCDPVSKEMLIKSAQRDQEEELRMRKYSYLDLFRTRPLIKKTVIMILSWFTSYLMYYIMTYNMEHLSGNRYLNLFFGGFVDLPAMLSTILLCNWIGRRFAYVFYSAVCMLCAVGVIIIFANNFSSDIISKTATGLALIAKSSGLGLTYVVQIYSAELFPTVIRNVGLGSGDIAGRVAATLSPLIVQLGRLYKMAPYITGLILCACVAPLNFLLPETNGQPLDDSVPLGKSHEEKESRGNDCVLLGVSNSKPQDDFNIPRQFRQDNVQTGDDGLPLKKTRRENNISEFV